MTAVPAPLYSPPTVNKGSHISTPWPALIVIWFLAESHCDWGELVSQGSFNKHYLVDTDVEHFIFGCISCFENSVWLLCSSFDWVVFFLFSFLCILVIYPLSDGKRFCSHSIGCLFTHLTVYFVVKRLLNFMRFHLSTVDLISRVPGVLFRKHCRVFSVYVFSSNFRVSHLSLRSLIHMDLTFVQVRDTVLASFPLCHPTSP